VGMDYRRVETQDGTTIVHISKTSTVDDFSSTHF